MVSENTESVFSKEDCEEILSAYDANGKLINYKTNKYSDKVVGFMAEHYLLTIGYSDSIEGDSVKYQTFFFKTAPVENEKQRDYVKKMGIFKKEILMYKNLINEFLKLSSKPFAPKYYFSKSDQCIVIENLSVQNYQVSNAKYMDYEKTKSVLETFARFHAASIVFEEQRSTKEEPYRINVHFPGAVQEATYSFTTGHIRNMWCINATNCVGNLSKFFTKDSKVAEKIRAYVFSDEGLKKFLKPSEKYRNVVCHDDLWRNNIMFKENNECVLIDFQLSRYTPPVFDVLLFFYTNLKPNLLYPNWSSFLDIYYTALRSELDVYNINTDNIISKADFLASVEEYSLPALVETCMYGTHTFLSEETCSLVVRDMETFEEFSFKNRSPFVIKEFENNDHVRERLSSVLKPLFELFKKM